MISNHTISMWILTTKVALRRRRDDEVEVNDLALTLSRPSLITSFSRGGSVGSGSANSHGSSTMETIDESGEEDDQVDDDPSPLASNAEDSCPDLN